MGQRMLRTSQMVDLEMDQQTHGHVRPEPPPIFMGGTRNFVQPNIHPMITASASTTNPCNDGAMFYGMVQFNGAHHHYYPYMTPASSSGMLPVPLNQAVSEHNSHFMDGVRGPCKRKMTEGIPWNFQYMNSASSSSSVPHLNAFTRHPDGVAVMDAVSFTVPQYQGNGNHIEHTHLSQANYMAQHHRQGGSSTFLLEQHLMSNSGDRAASSWMQASTMPYMHGTNSTGGSLDSVNMGAERYHEAARISSFRYPPATNPQLHGHHYPSPLMQGVRGHNVNFPPQIAGAADRLPLSSSRGTMNPSQNSMELGRRRPGPVPPTSIRIYRSHRGSSIPDIASRHHNLPHLRLLEADEVALLEIPDFYEIGNLVDDSHRDMRLDIEDMSYEELLALGDRIGKVSTGLSEEAVTSRVKTRTYISCEDQEADSCIICQDDYNDNEEIGILGCGHEYHADCLKKWLLVKNVCPICKSEAAGAAH